MARKKKAAPKLRKPKPTPASFDDFKAFLRSHLHACEHDGGGGDNLKFPNFDLMPQDYLSYAGEAIETPTDANKINCVAHLKRAAECQADTLFHVLSLSKRPQTKNFPRKMETIAHLGLIPSRSLSKLNRIRNQMEHEYAVPQIDDLELYFDLVAGFVAALEGALFMTEFNHMDFTWQNEDKSFGYLSMEYDTKNPKVESTMSADGGNPTVFTTTPDDWETFRAALRVFYLLKRYTCTVSSAYVLEHLDATVAT